jgi:hypothetical protein
LLAVVEVHAAHGFGDLRRQRDRFVGLGRAQRFDGVRPVCDASVVAVTGTAGAGFFAVSAPLPQAVSARARQEAGKAWRQGSRWMFRRATGSLRRCDVSDRQRQRYARWSSPCGTATARVTQPR